jgi:hypothetical protein
MVAVPMLIHPLPSFLFMLTVLLVTLAGSTVIVIVIGWEKVTVFWPPMVMSSAPAVELMVKPLVIGFGMPDVPLVGVETTMAGREVNFTVAPVASFAVMTVPAGIAMAVVPLEFVAVTAVVMVTVPVVVFSVESVDVSWVPFVCVAGDESSPQPPTISRAPSIAAEPRIFTNFLAVLFICSLLLPSIVLTSSII